MITMAYCAIISRLAYRATSGLLDNTTRPKK
jgi:hypothetical protein